MKPLTASSRIGILKSALLFYGAPLRTGYPTQHVHGARTGPCTSELSDDAYADMVSATEGFEVGNLWKLAKKLSLIAVRRKAELWEGSTEVGVKSTGRAGCVDEGRDNNETIGVKAGTETGRLIGIVRETGTVREKEIGKGTIKGVAAAGCSLYCTPNEVLASAKTCSPSSSSSSSSSASIRWCDIGGLHSAKQTITDVFLLPVIFRRMFQLSPIRMPRAVLLYGPPGCGKTVLAQAAATECGLAFISIRGNHGDYKLFFEVTNNVFSC